MEGTIFSVQRNSFVDGHPDHRVFQGLQSALPVVP